MQGVFYGPAGSLKGEKGTWNLSPGYYLNGNSNEFEDFLLKSPNKLHVTSQYNLNRYGRV